MVLGGKKENDMNKVYSRLLQMRILSFLFFIFGCMQLAFSQNVKEEPFTYSQALLDAAEKGEADAMYKIGVCYYVGKGGAPTMIKGEFPFERDYDKAFEYLSKAADKGSALAMLNLGNIYQTGIGAPKGKDLKQAIELFEKAAEKGCVDAYANIGKIYETEQPELITKKLVKIKIKDAANAAYMLWEEAVRYHQLAAEKGSAIGAYNLGIAYNSGLLGLAIDYEEATKWFRRATELGYKRATNDLAVRYMNGIGIPQNKRVGLELMKAAAMDEEPMALHNIGVYYYNGIGLTQNKEFALLFFLRANQLGYNNTQAIHECYLAGLHNAKGYATETDWLTALKNECGGKPLPEIILPEAQKVFTVAAGDVINDCGSWTIVDDEGMWITDRRYDYIVMDPATGKLTAGLYGYSTPLDDDGSEGNPILEQMLNGIEGNGDSQQISAKSLNILQADHDNSMGYRGMAYYNLAVYWHGMNLNRSAEIYLKKALEVEPNLEAANEALALLQEEMKEQQKARKKERRALIWKCITTGLSGVSDIMEQMAANKQAHQQQEASAKESNRQKNKEKARAAKQKSYEAKRNMAGMINRRGVSNAYTENVGILTDMKNSGQYGSKQFRQMQQQQKKLREKYGLTYNESEDW